MVLLSLTMDDKVKMSTISEHCCRYRRIRLHSTSIVNANLHADCFEYSVEEG